MRCIGVRAWKGRRTAIVVVHWYIQAFRRFISVVIDIQYSGAAARVIRSCLLPNTERSSNRAPYESIDHALIMPCAVVEGIIVICCYCIRYLSCSDTTVGRISCLTVSTLAAYLRQLFASVSHKVLRVLGGLANPLQCSATYLEHLEH